MRVFVFVVGLACLLTQVFADERSDEIADWPHGGPEEVDRRIYYLVACVPTVQECPYSCQSPNNGFIAIFDREYCEEELLDWDHEIVCFCKRRRGPPY